LSEPYITDWNKYVFGNESSTFAHQIEWLEILRRSFGHKPVYLLALEGEKITGILPMILKSSLIFGKFIVSLPWLDYGGICADSPQACSILLEKAVKIAKAERCEFLELRGITLIDYPMVSKTNKVSFFLDLDPKYESVWRKIDPKARNQVRKAEKSGLEILFGEKELLDEFYHVFSHNMRDLGTPVWSKKLFENILLFFPQKSEIALVKLRAQTIGGALILYFKDRMIIPSASSLKQFLSYCPNNLLYWESIKRAIGMGLKKFDFGRSTLNSGTYHFKKQWVKDHTQLYWQYYLNRPGELPEMNPENPKYRFWIKMWQKLPLSFTNFLGPKISRNLP